MALKRQRVRQRAPSPRVHATHQRLVAAAAEVLAEIGFSNLNYSAMARATGHSVTTVGNHFATPVTAAAAAWRTAFEAPLMHAFTNLFDAAGLGSGRASQSAFLQAFETFSNPSPTLSAATELLVVAGVEPAVEEAVAFGIRYQFEEWCLTQHGAPNASVGAQRAFLAMLALGLTLLHDPEAPHLNDATIMLEALYRALGKPTPAKPEPEITEPMPMDDDTFQIDTGDISLDRLLIGLLDVVGDVGLDRATTIAIGEAAGATEGLLFSRYKTKIDAFLDALYRHQQVVVAKQQTAAIALSERYGGAAIDVAATYRTLLPHRKKSRTVALEEVRQMRYHALVRERFRARKEALARELQAALPQITETEVLQRVNHGLSLGVGMLVLPMLLPNASELPFNVVFEAF